MPREEDNGFGDWGGYFEAKKLKLEEQFSAASDPFRQSNIFKGISIFVNGRVNPSADELKRIMMVHGGVYHHYERSHTDFIIASNLPDVKVRKMDTSKIISAQWVTDCVEQKRLVDFKPYLLYTNQKTTQPALKFGKRKSDESTTTRGSETLQKDLSSVLGELKEVDSNWQNGSKANADSISEAKVPSAVVMDSVKVSEDNDLSSYLEKLQVAANLSNGSTNIDHNSNQICPADNTDVDHETIVASPEKNSSAVTNISAGNSSHSARTAVDPAFLGEFYKNSRLHHIATLGAGFKQYVCELRQSSNNKNDNICAKRKELRELLSKPEASHFGVKTYVMHIDMDCFFVSVGLRNHPELRGIPVAVTHSKGGTAATDVPVHPQANRQLELELFAQRFEHHLHDNILADKVRSGFDKKMSLSEIASCSYEARAKGIKNGMFVGQALKLCPELKTIPYNFEGYRQVAFALYDTVAQYTLNIEAVSCDEMFVELTDLVSDIQSDVMSFVSHLRQEVFSVTGCPCSAGVSNNKLMARMATKLAKPNGQHLLDPEDAAQYMASMNIDVLPGVGSRMTYNLNQADLKTCGDVQKESLQFLERLLGKKVGQTLYQNCRGIDPRPLVYEQQRKSVSAEVNYGIRFTKFAELEQFLQQLSAEVHSRLLEIKRKTKTITLKLMVRAADAPVETSKYMGHGVCDNQTKSVQLKQYTDDVEVITHHVLKLMKESGYPPHELRGIGIHLGKLDEAVKQQPEKNSIKNMFHKMSVKQQENSTKSSNETATSKPIVESKPKAPKALDPLTMLRNAAGNNKKPRPAKASHPNLFKRIIVEEDEPDAFPEKEKSELPAAMAMFDQNVLAQMPEDIRREILSNPHEFLGSQAMDFNTISTHPPAGCRSPSPQFNLIEKRSARDSVIDFGPQSLKERPVELSGTNPCPEWLFTDSKELRDCVNQAEPCGMQKHDPSPLSESDMQPSTSAAAQAKQNARVDRITLDYMKTMEKFTYPAIMNHLKTNAIQNVSEEDKEAVKPLPIPVEQNSSGNQSKNRAKSSKDTEFRKMLSTWVKKEEVPRSADVKYVCDRLCAPPDDKNIEMIFRRMQYLCQLIKSKRHDSCRWHTAYRKIEDTVQDRFLESHNINLFLTETINCHKCQPPIEMDTVVID